MPAKWHVPFFAKELVLVVALLVSSAVPPCSQAQQRYTVADELADAEWATNRVAEGVTWRHTQVGKLFGLPQSLNVVEVDLTVRNIEIDVVSADSGRVRTSALARQAGAVAAVNGSFFDIEGGGETVVFSQRDGRVLKRSPQNAPSAFRSEAAVAARRDGDATVIRRDGESWGASLPAYEDVLASGPLLLWKAQPMAWQPVAFNVTHHPRTALGVTEDERLLLVTVDGRAPQAAGLTMRELAWVMQGLGGTAALNLDGGGSTTMWIKGRGVVNHPSDNGAFDHEGERAVANAVVVRISE
jgi:exopolysaccharide biosynthesis protein